MVCLGNICRSPLAEGILRDKIIKNNLDAIVESCGFENFHIGSPPDYRAIEVARINNVDIAGQCARIFQTSFFDYYDKILVMDQNNLKMVLAKARNQNDIEKVDLIMNLVYPESNLPVPDPYFGRKDSFQKTWDLLDEATDKIIDLIKTKVWS